MAGRNKKIRNSLTGPTLQPAAPRVHTMRPETKPLPRILDRTPENYQRPRHVANGDIEPLPREQLAQSPACAPHRPRPADPDSTKLMHRNARRDKFLTQ